MLDHLRRISVHGATRARRGLTRTRRDQAHPLHPRSHLPLIVPLLIVGVGFLTIATLSATRATPPTTSGLLPASAFRAVQVPDPTPTSRGLDVGSVLAATTNTVGGTAPTGVNVPIDRTHFDPPDRPEIRPAQTAVTPPRGPTHVVVPGDNLWTIAARHKADLAALIRWNKGVVPTRLVAGQRILVPGGSKMTPLPQPRPAAPRLSAPRPAVAARAPALRPSAGSHIWPLPVRGLLTRRFSAAHQGIDVAAPKGTPVRAIAAGTVVWAGWKNNGGGYVVVIKHPNGMTSTYNHTSRILVARGKVVGQGETIALVGSTGNSTGPHLDFRIEMGGRFVDPLNFY